MSQIQDLQDAAAAIIGTSEKVLTLVAQLIAAAGVTPASPEVQAVIDALKAETTKEAAVLPVPPVA
jgi:hypothetical protein